MVIGPTGVQYLTKAKLSNNFTVQRPAVNMNSNPAGYHSYAVTVDPEVNFEVCVLSCRCE